ncbi:MAG: hypothetical protein COV91_06010 [Candidatus Taylorbacteria bacterium CG11_big_fil_rev_8_21_14_0_20_46_11]|uniref:Uncharacterized protein n=1 Tax=Candidatus Taylorbacteria bacterium CG11_big_fil_rev_8_21_14_0_20_46_11 TaxID=1975025 RepID=A0A2H0KA07_9BACT|nr:MAG: hypothetical protein COV91_06010 [Candidatus Taylorbacteria bacterium CG11_big_fil_rev_8_21_14_0_20_46_11]
MTKEPPKPEDTLLQSEIDASKTEEQKRAETKKAEVEATFAPIIAEGNAILNQQIASINSQYDQLVAKQAEANARRVKLEETIGIRGGVARYTAGTAGDLVQDQVNIGLQKVAEWNAKRADAIAQLQTAHRKENMWIFKQAVCLKMLFTNPRPPMKHRSPPSGPAFARATTDTAGGEEESESESTLVSEPKTATSTPKQI